MKTLLLVIGFLISISFFTFSCRHKDSCSNESGVTIINNSTKRIYYELYWKYPDTSIGEYNPLQNGTDGLVIGESFIFGNNRGICWQELLSNNNKQYIHFFDADSLTIIPWDTVRKTQRGLLERREFDINYLQLHNWTLEYQ